MLVLFSHDSLQHLNVTRCCFMVYILLSYDYSLKCLLYRYAIWNGDFFAAFGIPLRN